MAPLTTEKSDPRTDHWVYFIKPDRLMVKLRQSHLITMQGQYRGIRSK